MFAVFGFHSTPRNAHLYESSYIEQCNRKGAGRFHAFIDYMSHENILKSKLDGNLSKYNTLRHENIFSSKAKSVNLGEK